MYKDLSQPCDLWVLPTPAASNWFARVDWYLNWQLCKGIARSGISLPIQIYRIAEENQMSLKVSKSEPQAPLLILSKGRIPADKCVVIDFNKTLRDWALRLHELALSLNCQTLQVFLPVGHSIEQFEKIWKTLPAGVEVRLSPDEEAFV